MFILTTHHVKLPPTNTNHEISAPARAYLSTLIQIYKPTRALRSTNHTKVVPPYMGGLVRMHLLTPPNFLSF